MTEFTGGINFNLFDYNHIFGYCENYSQFQRIFQVIRTNYIKPYQFMIRKLIMSLVCFIDMKDLLAYPLNKIKKVHLIFVFLSFVFIFVSFSFFLKTRNNDGFDC